MIPTLIRNMIRPTNVVTNSKKIVTDTRPALEPCGNNTSLGAIPRRKINLEIDNVFFTFRY